MSRPTKEIIAEIAIVRRDNRELYEKMGAFVKEDMVDTTLRLVEAAYAADPAKARTIHRQIAVNDTTILVLTKELCEEE